MSAEGSAAEGVLVGPAWLAERLADPAVRVVDLRWREDGSGTRAYAGGHVPGAAYCDWATDLVEPDAPVAFTLAGPETFAAAMARLGIGRDTTVVAYADRAGSGPFRLWWALRVYGHARTRVVDGGFERWLAEGWPVATGVAPPPAGPPFGGAWTPGHDPRWICDAGAVLEARDHREVALLDSRPREQFRGREVWFETGAWPAAADGLARTPRGSLRAGHVPWARSVPWSALYRPDGRMRSPRDLRRVLAEVGAGDADRVITYCGCGISASALAFAAVRAGFREVAIYDASWEEWGRDPSLPVERDA